MSNATWSLRLRPVWSFFPASPIRSVRTASTKLWMSSYWDVISSRPSSTSARIPFSPSTMRAFSSSVRIFLAASIVTCAMLPRMSCRYNLLSNVMEALKLYTSWSVSFVNRPPHSCAMCDSPFPFLPPCRRRHRLPLRENYPTVTKPRTLASPCFTPNSL